MKDKTANILIIDGGTVKTSESGTVEGLGIVFGSENEPDSSKERDFFTKESFIRKKEQFVVPMYYNHGLGPIKTEIGEATLTKEEAGWRVSGQIDTTDDIGKTVYDAIKEKPHGFSTGALQHLVKREAKSNGTNFLKQWVVGEISLTERPAERKAVVESIKSLDGEVIDTTDAWVESDASETKTDIPNPKEGATLIAIFNEKGEKIWDVDEATFTKIVEIAGETKCGMEGYSYVSVNGENASVTVSPDADIEALIANLQSAINMLQSFTGKHLKEAASGQLIKKIEELVSADSTKCSDCEDKAAQLEQELADLRTELSTRDEALTQANKEIAQLKILAGATETIKNAKV